MSTSRSASSSATGRPHFQDELRELEQRTLGAVDIVLEQLDRTLEALAHQDAVIERVTRTVAERISVGERLAALGLHVADSQANFCWVALGEQHDEQEVTRGLRERGVLVRGGSALGSSTPALRVTYGLPEENTRFLDALAEVLQPATTH